jgi:hypothetical protein
MNECYLFIFYFFLGWLLNAFVSKYVGYEW